MNSAEQFEKWCPVKVVDAEKAPNSARIVKNWRTGWDAGWQAGAEQMRERAAVVADEWSCRNAFEWARYKENIVDSIRALPVGESSRAPEGSTKS